MHTCVVTQSYICRDSIFFHITLTRSYICRDSFLFHITWAMPRSVTFWPRQKKRCPSSHLPTLQQIWGNFLRSGLYLQVCCSVVYKLQCHLQVCYSAIYQCVAVSFVTCSVRCSVVWKCTAVLFTVSSANAKASSSARVLQRHLQVAVSFARVLQSRNFPLSGLHLKVR